MLKRRITTNSIALVHQHLRGNQLRLSPEFQRNAVWPKAAKAYLIDTILSERPMPLFFFHRALSPQTGKHIYSVVDGQQRLRAIFEFMEDGFALTESKDSRWRGKRYSELSQSLRYNLANYDLTVEELTEYNDKNIRDIFVRMNRYVVKLSPQELRHARDHGAFYEFVEELARIPYWKKLQIFTAQQLNRMKAAEFSAELAILLIEGPQDKKSSLDLYYREYQTHFRYAKEVHNRLVHYLRWISQALPDINRTRFRKPTDLYGLVGAIAKISRNGRRLHIIDPKSAGILLREFDTEIRGRRRSPRAIAYIGAASRQTDNIGPRNTRIDILTRLLS